MTEVIGMTRRDSDAVQELFRQVARLRAALPPSRSSEGTPVGNAKWKNIHASTCPAGGIIKLSNIQLDSDSTGDYYYEGTRPDGAVVGVIYAVNGTEEVPQNGYGSCTIKGYAFVDVTGDTSSGTGLAFGAVSGSWLAKCYGHSVGYLVADGTCLSANTLTPCIVGDIKPFRGRAKTNWKKRGGTWPTNAGNTAYVEVDRIDTFSDITKTIRVYLPSIASKDPNVVSSQEITFVRHDTEADPDNSNECYYVATGDYSDDAIGTVKMTFTLSGIKQGWVLADGTQNTAKTLSGQAYDLYNRFPLGAGGTGATEITAATTGDGDLTILASQVVDASKHFGTASGALQSGTNITNHQAGDDIELTHAFGGNTPGSSYAPRHRGVYFIERIDNSS